MSRIAVACALALATAITGCEEPKRTASTIEGVVLLEMLERISIDHEKGMYVCIDSAAPIDLNTLQIPERFSRERFCLPADVREHYGWFFYRSSDREVVKIMIKKPKSIREDLAAVVCIVVYDSRVDDVYSMIAGKHGSQWVVHQWRKIRGHTSNDR